MVQIAIYLLALPFMLRIGKSLSIGASWIKFNGASNKFLKLPNSCARKLCTGLDNTGARVGPSKSVYGGV